MKYFVLILILSASAVSQWTMSSGSSYVPPPPPPGSEPWRGILDFSRAVDWSHVGIEGGIPTYTYDCGTVQPTGLKAWEPNKQYNAGDAISDTRGNKEMVFTPGISGVTEPSNAGGVPAGSWPIVEGNTTAELAPATVVWQMTRGQTDSANVTNALISCSDQVAAAQVRGGVVTLTAGTYYFTRGIYFNRGWQWPQTTGNPSFTGAPVNNVLLKGQGPMQTYLRFPRVGACGGGDICIQAFTAGFTGYAGGPGTGYGTTTYPGGAAKWMGTSALDVYNKGETQVIAGPWTPDSTVTPEPAVGDILFFDQNNDAISICPATPPANPGNCTVAGATAVGNIATIVTTVPHGFTVGQCIGIGDMPTKANNTGNNAPGYNTGMNPDKTNVLCNGPPYLPAWWQISDVGCIVSSAFVTQANCGANPIVAFQFNLGRTAAECPTTSVNCLAPNGGGQATADTLGTWITSVGGATMTVGSNPDQSSRRCDNPQAAVVPNPSCAPGETSIRSAFEAKRITAITLAGQGTCPATAYKCYTINPPLYMNNWRSSQRPGVWWTGPKASGDGLEGFTYLAEHDPGDGTKFAIKFINATNGWVRNTRGIDINRSFVSPVLSTRITIMDNYIGGTKGGASTAYVFEDNAAADTLVMNNICQHTVSCLMTQSVMGRVAAYNFMIDAGYILAPGNLMPLMTMIHLAAFYNLFEGNDSAGIQTDNQHGTGGVSTAFRSRSRAQDLPNKAVNRNGLSSSSNNRGLNYVGMVMGWLGLTNRYLDDNPANASSATDNTVFAFGQWQTNNGARGLDRLSSYTSVRWGNYDVATQATRWCGDSSNCSCGLAAVGQYCRLENETALQGYTFLAPNAVPANHNLPNSFFLTGPPAFWTTTWGTPGWPPIGPDVDATGSPFDTSCQIIPPNGYQSTVGTGPNSFTRCDGEGAHHAYQIPAQICYNNLPIDTQVQQYGRTVQRTFTVTNASWASNGCYNNRPCVTLQANNDLVLEDPVLKSKFTYTMELTGIDPPGYNGTFQIESFTPTTITYWLATSPGLFNPAGSTGAQAVLPNYKQFDARWCYPNEFPGQTAPPPMP